MSSHTLLLGSPCAHADSTMPSWPQTIRAANSRSQRCNRMSSRNRLGWNNRPHNCMDLEVAELFAALGNPNGECGSTKPSCLVSNHTGGPQRNCTDQAVVRAWYKVLA